MSSRLQQTLHLRRCSHTPPQRCLSGCASCAAQNATSAHQARQATRPGEDSAAPSMQLGCRFSISMCKERKLSLLRILLCMGASVRYTQPRSRRGPKAGGHLRAYQRYMLQQSLT